MGADVRWTVVLAVKSLPAAKSRLRGTGDGELDDLTHADLVRAMRADTRAAVDAAGAVGRTVVIGDQLGPGITLVQSLPGLNAALSEAAQFARHQWPDDGVVALVADLPSLRAADLDAALAHAGDWPRAFVPDSSGLGTTTLTARAGVDLAPSFGPGSARRHAEQAQPIASAAPGLRQDVDTWADLVACAELGLGPRTAAAYRAFTSARHDVGHDRLLPGH